MHVLHARTYPPSPRNDGPCFHFALIIRAAFLLYKNHMFVYVLWKEKGKHFVWNDSPDTCKCFNKIRGHFSRSFSPTWLKLFFPISENRWAGDCPVSREPFQKNERHPLDPLVSDQKKIQRSAENHACSCSKSHDRCHLSLISKWGHRPMWNVIWERAGEMGEMPWSNRFPIWIQNCHLRWSGCSFSRF